MTDSPPNTSRMILGVAALGLAVVAITGVTLLRGGADTDPAAGGRTVALLLGPDAAAATEGAKLALSQLGDGWTLLEVEGVHDSAAASRALTELAGGNVVCVVDASAPGALTSTCAKLIREKLVVASVTQTNPNLQGVLGGSYLQLAPEPSPLGKQLAETAKQVRVQRPAVVTVGAEAAAIAESIRVHWGLSESLVFPLESEAQVPWLFEQLGRVKPDTLILLTPPALAGTIAAHPEAASLVRILGGEALVDPAFVQAAGSSDLSRVIALCPPEAGKLTRDPTFEAAWSAAHEEPASELACLSYDAVRLVVAGYEQAERATPQPTANLVAGATRGQTLVGASGPLTLDPNGSRTSAACVLRTFTQAGVQVPWRQN